MTATTALLRRLRRFEDGGVLGSLVLLCLALGLATSAFFTQDNLLQVTRQASYYGTMALGMVFVLAIGDVDLSVGSVMLLANVLAAIALREGAPLPLALALGLGAGAACGFLNGALSVLLRIPTIIITLGTMSVYRGLALVVSDATPVSQFDKRGAFFDLGGWVPAGVLTMLAVGGVAHVLFDRTPFGRRVQAIGSNARAARLAGVAIARHRILVMTLMGAIAGLAGLMALAFLQAADPSTGAGLELLVIASAVIGGTALTGGSGSVLGALLGALIIAVIRNGLVLLGLTAYWAIVVTGAVIIAAVAVDYVIKRRPEAST
jgi:ribose transport system permease protein